MQIIARDMNLSETVFITVSTQATARLRFFTPALSCLWPAIPPWPHGTRLVELGRVHLDTGPTMVSQELNVGVLPVEIRRVQKFS